METCVVKRSATANDQEGVNGTVAAVLHLSHNMDQGRQVYIQRSSGCNHMVCSRCATDFCYDCGQKYYLTRTNHGIYSNRLFKYTLGTHSSKLSPLGCSHNFLRKHVAARRLIRGSVLGLKVLGGACGLVLAAGVGVVMVGLSPVLGGIMLGIKIKKNRRRARDPRRWRP
ncbi:E3 ubiquitin-protein ligase RNF217-like [Babylonia areolata]|uniref:E3 ubiquitin-protein ligase RNF217-like n=1 Tax=Babylonia areolata TaxID=304850 RepID=UPI003FD262F8